MKKSNKYIDVTREHRKFIAQLLNISERMVMLSLEYKRGSELARRIREIAIKRGGIIMRCLPEMETIHDADGYMRQRFPNGVLLECNKETSHVDIFKDGRVVAQYDDVKIDQLPAIQARAQHM